MRRGRSRCRRTRQRAGGQFLAFLVKTFIFLFVFIWLRGTLPRLRYDQFMRLGWKVLVPRSLLWILAVFALRTYRNAAAATSRRC